MANAGPNTNGAQFFITVSPTPHLNGNFMVFGKVLSGYDVVERASKVATGPGDQPTEPVVLSACRAAEEDGAAFVPNTWEKRVYGEGENAALR
jgi:cyclophilin family peptidyl-prolyl cis-trans isomerase